MHFHEVRQRRFLQQRVTTIVGDYNDSDDEEEKKEAEVDEEEEEKDKEKCALSIFHQMNMVYVGYFYKQRFRLQILQRIL